MKTKKERFDRPYSNRPPDIETSLYIITDKMDESAIKTIKLIRLIEDQNKILSKNTIFTGAGALIGLVALVMAFVSLILSLK